MTKAKYIFHQLGAVSLFLILAACGSAESDGKSSSTESDGDFAIQTVEVTSPKIRSFVAEILITGTAQANQDVMLFAMESGYVERIKKDIGDEVRKGESLVSLTNPEITRLFEQKTANLKAKKSIYDRLNKTYKETPSITPEHLVDQAEAEYLIAESELKFVKNRMSYLTITQRMVDRGALVQSGLEEDNPQPIMQIQEMKTIRLRIPMPESDIADIKKGTEVNVTFPELPAASYNLTVSRTANSLDPASKTMQVEIDVPNSNGIIKPGMYAKVLVKNLSRDSVLSLPVTAQYNFQDALFLMVVKDGIVGRIPLRKGLSNKDYFEVLNTEISENTQIIIQGKRLVKPGQKVKAIEAKEE